MKPMRQQIVIWLGRRAFYARCLAAQIAPLVRCGLAQAQTGTHVEISVAPTLFQTSQESNALLCFSSIDTSALTLKDGDTFTFFFPITIGTAVTTGAINVSAVTLTSASFTAAVTTTPSQMVVVTYRRIAATQVLNFGDTVCVNTNFAASGTAGTAKVSLETHFNKLAHGDMPFSVVDVVGFSTP